MFVPHCVPPSSTNTLSSSSASQWKCQHTHTQQRGPECYTDSVDTSVTRVPEFQSFSSQRFPNEQEQYPLRLRPGETWSSPWWPSCPQPPPISRWPAPLAAAAARQRKRITQNVSENKLSKYTNNKQTNTVAPPQ